NLDVAQAVAFSAKGSDLLQAMQAMTRKAPGPDDWRAKDLLGLAATCFDIGIVARWLASAFADPEAVVEQLGGMPSFAYDRGSGDVAVDLRSNPMVTQPVSAHVASTRLLGPTWCGHVRRLLQQEKEFLSPVTEQRLKLASSPFRLLLTLLDYVQVSGEWAPHPVASEAMLRGLNEDADEAARWKARLLLRGSARQEWARAKLAATQWEVKAVNAVAGAASIARG
ncbi:unnamed protein product, partial [Effrenium voratum]